MKKLFTLIAAALFAVGASAGEVQLTPTGAWGTSVDGSTVSFDEGKQWQVVALTGAEDLILQTITISVDGGFPSDIQFKIQTTEHNGNEGSIYVPITEGETTFSLDDERLQEGSITSIEIQNTIDRDPFKLVNLVAVATSIEEKVVDLTPFTANDVEVSFGKPRVIEDPANAANHCVIITSLAAAEFDYNTQLFISVPEELAFKEGDVVGLAMKVKADKAQENSAIQLHEKPGGYLHWAGPTPVNFTTEWAQYEGTCTIDASGVGAYTLAIGLAVVGGESNNLYFDDIVLTVNGKTLVDEDFEGVISGIANVVASKPMNNGAIYNLAGQKVDKNYKGIVIMNGKKFIQK